jgi:hypothetical protein
VKPPPPRRKTRALIGFLAGIAFVLVAYLLSRRENPGWDVESGAPSPRTPASAGLQLQDGYSNIHTDDYLGPDACVECHQKQHALWRTHPHSRMNLDAKAPTVLGDFSDRSIRYGDMQVLFHREGDAFRMSVSSADSARRRRYRVTRTVGSRFTQMYIGVQIEGPEPSDHPIYRDERKLPFGFWITRDRWLPVNYFDSDFLPDYAASDSDMVDEERLFKPNEWERNCIYCHNTYPYAARLRSGLANMSGFPRGDLKLNQEEPTTRRLPVDTLVTLGISCESCHFGGREHVRHKKPVRFVPSAPDLDFRVAGEALVKGARDNPYVINSICAQCHAAEGVSQYPNGAGTWNSREALDLLGGACTSDIKCTDCHEPHTPGPAGGSPDRPEHIAACVECHSEFKQEGTRKAHSRHGPSVTCLDCHMPRIVQGLDAVVRSHRISSPTEPSMLRQAAPNACNLCHLDQSISWTLEELSKGWRPIKPGDGWAKAHGGNLTTPMGEVWLKHDVPVTRLVVTAAYARAGDDKAHRTKLLGVLNDENPVNRMFALFAVEKWLGRKLDAEEYEPTAPPTVRKAQVSKLASTLD